MMATVRKFAIIRPLALYRAGLLYVGDQKKQGIVCRSRQILNLLPSTLQDGHSLIHVLPLLPFIYYFLVSRQGVNFQLRSCRANIHAGINYAGCLAQSLIPQMAILLGHGRAFVHEQLLRL